MDNTTVFGTVDGGSIPSGGTNKTDPPAWVCFVWFCLEGIERRSDVLRRRLASKTARGGLRKIFRKKNLFVGDSTHSTVKRGGGRRWPDKIFGRKF